MTVEVWRRASLLGCLTLLALPTLTGGPAQAAAVAPAVLTATVPGLLGSAPTSPFADEYVKYYTVTSADETLTGIAGRLLGTTGRAREIYHLNAGRRQPDGQALTDSMRLVPGWSLVLPWDAVGEGVRHGLLPSAPPAPDVPGAPAGGAVGNPDVPVRPASPPGGTPPAAPGASTPTPGRCAPPTPSRADSGWAYERMAADQAWSRTRGEGVLVAVVDSGVDGTVPELTGRVAVGADIPTGGGRGDTDCLGSGTAMAGIVAARPSTPGATPTSPGATPTAGAVGLAPAATILPLRVVHGGSGSGSRPADAATAIEVAVSAGAKVVALGAYVDLADVTVLAAIRAALHHDVVVVAPAPAAGAGAGAPPPAELERVLRVGGVGPDGQPAAGHLPSGVDVVAPGIDVASLGANGSGVRASSGPQYAVAFVAGVVTLVRSAFPHLDVAQVVHRVKVTADRVGQASPDPLVGWGMVNPAAAVRTVLAEEARVASPPETGRGPLGVLTVVLVVGVGLAAVAVLARRSSHRSARSGAADRPRR